MKYFNALLLSIALVSCNSEDEPMPLDATEIPEPVKDVEVPADATGTAMGTFTGFAHALSGKAAIYTDTDNKRTLRLENFTMTAGPDVYVFLSKSNNYSTANTIPVGVLKEAYSESNLTFDVDDTIDLNEHKFVLVYCLQFSSLFGFAEPM